MNKKEEIKRIMRREGYVPLSLACKQYTSIRYNPDTDEVTVKWWLAWDCEEVTPLSDLHDYETDLIYEDVKRLE